MRSLFVSLLLFVTACAHSSATEIDNAQLARSIDALRAQVASQEQLIEVMQGRLDVLAVAGTSRGSVGRSTRDLEVVKLTPAFAPAPPEEEPIMLEITGEGDRLQVVKMPPAPHAKPKSANAAPAPAAPAKADPLDGPFAEALDAYRNGRTEEAFERFSNLLKRNPKAEKAAAALYWMGESRFDDQRYEDAIIMYKRLIDTYGSSSKAAEALLKIGIAFEKLHDGTRAREAFQRLVDEHPDSAVAELARARSGVHGSRK